jgi:hypothetical protein
MLTLRITVTESDVLPILNAEIMKAGYLFIFIITKHYLLTAPISYGDIWWRDNPFNPVT